MLNTESKLVGLTIWAAIAAMVVISAWSLFGWPAAPALIASLLDSELAAFIQRNQTILAGVVGIGGAAVAYLLNGWRDRQERRHAIERGERRTGGVMAREAGELARVCEGAARSLTVRGLTPETVVAGLHSQIAAKDNLLLSAPMSDIARLGTGVAVAVRGVRGAMRRLNEELDAANREDGAGGRIAGRALAVSFAAGHAARVLDALAKSGVRAADRVRATHEAANADPLASAEEDARPSRLQPAA